MQIVAQGWLIWRLSRSEWLLALDQVLAAIPIFLFTLIGGVIADRIDRRHVLIGSQVVQMSCATILTLLVAFHVVRVWEILTLSFVSGFAQAFGGPAYQALVPTLVNKEDMPNAIALMSIQFNAAVTVGPALGGIALARLGEAWCFGLNAASFAAPIIALLLLTVRFLPTKTGESILTSLKQGVHFVRKQSAMEALMVLAFLMTALGMPFRTYFPVFATDVFHKGPEILGTFYSVMGVGSIAGSLTMASLGNFRNKGRVALTMLMCLGAGVSGFCLSTHLAFSYILLFIAGASMISVFTAVNSLVQLITTDEMRGRVMSLYNFAFRGGMPMGNLLTGQLVPHFTAPIVLSVNGALLVALGVYFMFVQRRVAAL
jgi:predicted MFS family arabinose efflux permease